MSYIMNIDENDNATFKRINHKQNKKVNKQKYKRLLKIKKKSKRMNRHK